MLRSVCTALHQDIFGADFPKTGFKINFRFFVFLPRDCCDIPNVVVEWLLLLLRIPEVPGSNIGFKTTYPEWKFHGFPQSIQANTGVVP
jgi:hypothetical protein